MLLNLTVIIGYIPLISCKKNEALIVLNKRF